MECEECRRRIRYRAIRRPRETIRRECYRAPGNCPKSAPTLIRYSTCATMSAMRKLIFLAVLLLSSCSSTPGKTTLIVYSPHGKELLTEFEKRFEAQNPNIDVRWLDMGSQDALDRVRS